MKEYQLLTAKAEAIYSRERETSLFALVAEKRFNSGKYEEAIEVLEKGIENFPDYATPYFILAKVLLAKGDTEKAREVYEKGKRIFSSVSLEEYFEKLFAGEISLLSEDDANPILQELNEDILPDKEEVEAETEEFATLTLAEVYESQGAYEEAISVYKKLIEKEPENAEKYSAKISELEAKLNNQ